MSASLSTIYLDRHAETIRSISGQRTGHTDLPLTGQREQAVWQLKARLVGLKLATVFTSPLQRARRTCELAGFAARAADDRDLSEWDYGDCKGIRSAESHPRLPGWEIFPEGCPGGASRAQVGGCWLGFNASAGRSVSLDAASMSALGYENSPAHPGHPVVE